jgi:ABC-2 type transport system ATP-binding protein
MSSVGRFIRSLIWGPADRPRINPRCSFSLLSSEKALFSNQRISVIEVSHLTKRYGEKLAVNDMTFTVRPGVVTGFLGPNGAGKSTTMRLILGLDRPTSGAATISGRPYQEFSAPLQEVGALLEARSVHTGRSAYNHLLAMAQTHGIPRARVREVISMVGLDAVAQQRAGGFSLGMGQRLGIAAALLGDPEVIMLDEPTNGLDPEGIHWIRDLLRRMAAEGRTVFLSSHLMSEMSLTAEHLVIVGRGRVLRDMPLEDFVAEWSRNVVRVISPQASELRSAILAPDVRVTASSPSVLDVEGLSSQQVGEAAARIGAVLHELIPQKTSLEEAFMQLTQEESEYRADRVETPDAEFELERVAA